MVNNTAKDACKKSEKCLFIKLCKVIKSNHDCAYNYFVSVLLTSDDVNKYVAMANKRTYYNFKYYKIKTKFVH